MKIKIIYLVCLSAAVGLILLLTSSVPSPDTLLTGTWQEESWEYEKVDQASGSDSLSGKQIAESVKRLIAQDLIVHRAEKWQFKPDGTLRLFTERAPGRRLNWKMKGRGHILVLHYNDRMEESYTVAELTENHMVLHFYTEMQARGIAKITFTRTN
jgi:hypothetical protein